MIDFDIKVDIKGVQSQFNRAAARFKNGLDNALGRSGKDVTRQAQRYAPIDTGLLSDSITYRVNKNNGMVDIFVPKNSRAGKYASVMEYGHYKKGNKTKSKSGAGRYYMHRALNDSNSSIMNNIRSLIKTFVGD